jgi:hypothetical protein
MNIRAATVAQRRTSLSVLQFFLHASVGWKKLPHDFSAFSWKRLIGRKSGSKGHLFEWPLPSAQRASRGWLGALARVPLPVLT